ncbi:MAG TPA: hypothetical protein PK156_42735, partial [Polyangium sp.]|nr:hypothetical protein [Polyangium sp.]
DPENPELCSVRYYPLLLDLGRFRDVRERAAQALQSALRQGNLLEIALDNLFIGRAHLIELQRSADRDLKDAVLHIKECVNGLRSAGMQEMLPLGLLARADLHIHTREFANARRDLDEAMTIATRCGFRLHECDAHLGYARLAVAEGNRAKAREHLEKARKIVEETGYHRRDGELAELETQIASMPETAKPTIPASAIPDQTNAEGMPHVNPSNESFDIAIICALHVPELEHARWVVDDDWAKFRKDGDPTMYEQTIFTTKAGNQLRVVAAAASQMGMPASAVLATKMIFHFRPKLVAMVGIAAGVEGDGRDFGDILVPDCTLDYGAGKIIQKEGALDFQPDPKPLRIDPQLQKLLEDWQHSRHHELFAIKRRFRSDKPNTDLKMHVGTLASGAAVVAAANRVEQVREHWRKLIGIEMEAYGVHLACHEAVGTRPMFLCMKSVCDFANGKKNDDWQQYAAHTSAQLCYQFLINEWEELFPR